MNVETMMNHLALAFGGMSQVSPNQVASALAGQVNNNGMFSTESMQNYTDEEKNKFRQRIEEGIRQAAEIYAPDDESYYVVIRECFLGDMSSPLTDLA